MAAMFDWLLHIVLHIVPHLPKPIMKTLFPGEHLSKNITVDVGVTAPGHNAPELSVSSKRVTPILLEIANGSRFFTVEVMNIDANIMVDEIEVGAARARAEEPEAREIPYLSTRHFKIDSAWITEEGRQKIAHVRNPNPNAVDYLNAVLSVRIMLKAFFREFLVTRDLPVRILINN
jgi:hypothetical protein